MYYFDNLRDFNDSDIEEFIKSLKFSTKTEINTKEELMEAFAKYNLSIENICVNIKSHPYMMLLEKFYYNCSGFLIDIKSPQSVDSLCNYLSDMRDIYMNYFEKDEKTNEVYSLFQSIPRSYESGLYIIFEGLLLDEHRINLGEHFFKSLDYGSIIIPKRIVKTLFKEKIKELDKLCDSNDMLTLYRGMADKSTNEMDAYSWTLDKKIAVFFAKRFGDNKKIATLKIHKSFISGYTGDEEEEVILFLKDIDKENYNLKVEEF